MRTRARVAGQRGWGPVVSERVVVAFDTATDALAVGIGRWSGQEVRVEVSLGAPAPRKANTVLLPVLRDQLAGLGLGAEDIGAVVVGRGPGSFTGVRIGVATAKGLAQGLRVPLYGVGTLDALAWRFAGREGLLGVVGDAMRGEVYPALFRMTAGRVERLTDDTVQHPGTAAREWASELDEPLVLAGNGLAKHAEEFSAALGTRAVFAPAEEWVLTGEGLLAAFGAALAAGCMGDGDPGALLPVYTRLSDAEEAERARAGLGSGEPPASGVAGGMAP